MKIGNHAEKAAAAAATPATAASAATSTANAAAATSSSAIPSQADPSAKIQLSSTASNLLSSSTPEFDADKVARMSQAISDGSYKVNHGAIADKLIANAKEVLGKVSS